jgi:hypothetical protein
MNNTPRTDAQTGYAVTGGGIVDTEYLYIDKKGPFVSCGFARQLELENIKLRKAVEHGRAYAEAQMLKILSEAD